jgi:hypothetical protein
MDVHDLPPSRRKTTVSLPISPARQVGRGCTSNMNGCAPAGKLSIAQNRWTATGRTAAVADRAARGQSATSGYVVDCRRSRGWPGCLGFRAPIEIDLEHCPIRGSALKIIAAFVM